MKSSILHIFLNLAFGEMLSTPSVLKCFFFGCCSFKSHSWDMMHSSMPKEYGNFWKAALGVKQPDFSNVTESCSFNGMIKF